MKKILNAQKLKLKKSITWYDVAYQSEGKLSILGSVKADKNENPKAVIMFFHFSDPLLNEQLKENNMFISVSNGLPCQYLPRLDGNFEISVQIPEGNKLRYIGLSLWSNERPIFLTDLTIEYQEQKKEKRKKYIHVTIDVEAFRPQGIDKLIWGEFDGNKMGLPSFIEVAESLCAKFSFYLDFAEYEMYGDKLLDVGRYVIEQGHDLQLHAHTSVLREMFLRQYGYELKDFRSSEGKYLQYILEYCIEKYSIVSSIPPVAFRAGSLRFGKNLVNEARGCGFKILSNYTLKSPYGAYFSNDLHTNLQNADDLFLWDNGVLEIPIHVNMLLNQKTFSQLLSSVRQALEFSKTGVVTLLLHSWSFLERENPDLFVYRGENLKSMFYDLLLELSKEASFVTTKEIASLYENKSICPGKTIMKELLD